MCRLFFPLLLTFSVASCNRPEHLQPDPATLAFSNKLREVIDSATIGSKDPIHAREDSLRSIAIAMHELCIGKDWSLVERSFKHLKIYTGPSGYRLPKVRTYTVDGAWTFSIVFDVQDAVSERQMVPPGKVARVTLATKQNLYILVDQVGVAPPDSLVAEFFSDDLVSQAGETLPYLDTLELQVSVPCSVRRQKREQTQTDQVHYSVIGLFAGTPPGSRDGSPYIRVIGRSTGGRSIPSEAKPNSPASLRCGVDHEAWPAECYEGNENGNPWARQYDEWKRFRRESGRTASAR